MHGILLLNKPKGMTSHDCVVKIRRLLRERKVGHTGTLDPDVTGVLPICVGRATKLVEYITSESKTYEGEVTLGFSTTTEDSSGELVKKTPVNRVITREEILQVLDALTGDILQTPPMYSAIKVNGKKLYEYARQGIQVERPTRQIHIHELALLDDRATFTGKNISFRFRVTCSKGTYVRTLAVMIGERLGFASHMSDLIRTASGAFQLADCLTFAEVEQHVANETLSSMMIPIDKALPAYLAYQVDAEITSIVKNGGFLQIPTDFPEDAKVAVYDEKKRLLAIYCKHPKKSDVWKPEKVLVNNQELK